MKLSFTLILILTFTFGIAQRWEDDADYTEIENYNFEKDFNPLLYYGTAIVAGILYVVGVSYKNGDNELLGWFGRILMVIAILGVIAFMAKTILATIFLIVQIGIGVGIIVFAAYMAHSKDN